MPAALLVAASLAAAPAARAAEAVATELVARAQEGLEPPALLLHVREDLSDLSAEVRCDDGASARVSGSASAGETLRLPLRASLGRHSCSGTLRVVAPDGAVGEGPLSFEVVVLPPLGVTVPRERVDVDARRLEVVLDRPAGRVSLEVFGRGGRRIGGGEVAADGTPAGTPIPVEWAQDGPGPVVRLRVRAEDADGFWAAVDLFPWYYEIPHEDVVFETGKSEIRPSEEPKLRAALGRIREVVDTWGDEAVLRLYVAGYTDRVGDVDSNLWLSRRRAEAIGRWFRDHGFPGPIYVQGFGERGLAVPTPDEVPEERNRRALYVVAAEPPPVSEQVPGSDWTELR